MSTIQDYKGQLVIVDNWQTAYTDPVEYRLYWPTGVKTRVYDHLVGQRVVEGCETGIYRIDSGEQNSGLQIRLENGGKTTSVHCEERPVKKPRGAKNWRYGRWEKY